MFQLKRGNKRSGASAVKEKGSSKSLGLFLIGLFKVGKGILFTALGIGLLKLVDKDIDDLFRAVISQLHIDEENHYVQHIIDFLGAITDHRLRELSVASFIFSGLLFIEAIGLFGQRIWAQFMTIVETSLFIPFEIYEIIRQGTHFKVIILAINIAIVTYLLFVVLRKEQHTLSRDTV
jgi:uncharacterized membrane protein (DUF2068 family)